MSGVEAEREEEGGEKRLDGPGVRPSSELLLLELILELLALERKGAVAVAAAAAGGGRGVVVVVVVVVAVVVARGAAADVDVVDGDGLLLRDDGAADPPLLPNRALRLEAASFL